jgi:DNA (cytosine-5)-methyltransferase 1
LKVIDLFCGAGGFSEGFGNAGFEVILAVDIWPIAAETYSANHPGTNFLIDDLERISHLPDREFNEIIPDSEIIIGSPPCVAFSNSNKSGKADKTNGIKLVDAFLRIVARKKFKENSILKYWIMENVPNVIGYVKESYSAEELGCNFSVEFKITNSGIYLSENYDVPSRRKRYFCGEFPNPEIISNSVKPLKSILNALNPPRTNLSSIIEDPNYPSLKLISHSITDHHYIQEIAEYQWKTALRLKQDRGYMGRMSFPEDKDKLARTIMATMTFGARESMIFGLEGKDNRYRAPTIREVACLMSFPIDYLFCGSSKGIKYALVGNAVPPKMAYAFAIAIANRENIKVSQSYVKLARVQNKDFYNLNNKIFSIPLEKPKLVNSRFKYHLPYLIIDAFRVELTNYKSDFKSLKFIWNVEIHKSQGKRAKVFCPEIIGAQYSSDEQMRIDQFLNSLSISNYDFDLFQRIYCMTSHQRKEAGMLGPYELLERTREFINNSLLKNNEVESELVLIPEAPWILPKPIMVGYYILQKAVHLIGD